MMRLAIGLLLVAIIAAIFGFGGIAATATDFAKIVFVVALVLAVVSFIFGRGSSALVVLLAAGAALALPGRAMADDDMRVQGYSNVRSGFTGGIGVGAGHIECDDACEGMNEAGGVGFHLGAMVSPSLAVVLDVWGMRHDEDRSTFSQGIVAGALKAWVLPRLYLMGGVGVAQASWQYDADVVELSDKSETVPAIIGGVGLELLSSPTFALDVQLRGGEGFYEDDDVRVRNVQLGVGVAFF
jgi:uncharacterized membrane protein YtjA (UPF0391 family)